MVTLLQRKSDEKIDPFERQRRTPRTSKSETDGSHGLERLQNGSCNQSTSSTCERVSVPIQCETVFITVVSVSFDVPLSQHRSSFYQVSDFFSRAMAPPLTPTGPDDWQLFDTSSMSIVIVIFICNSCFRLRKTRGRRYVARSEQT